MGDSYLTHEQHTVTCNNQIIDERELSDLYKACFENDVERVRLLLQTSSFETINSREVNGSTALHIAVEGGHKEIIRLLLYDFNASRDITDSQGRTVFELAQTDEIRQIFRQSTFSRNRFCTTTNFSTMFSRVVNDNKEIPCGRVQGVVNFTAVREHYVHEIYPHCDNIKHRLLDLIPFSLWDDETRPKHSRMLLEIIEEHIDLTKPWYLKVKELMNHFRKSGDVNALIRLYTLETPFYRYINQNKESSDILALPIYHGLRFLRSRAFKGYSYRGLSMTDEDLDAYQWADRHNGHYLITNTFCSSTKDKTQAIGFGQANAHDHYNPVLMIFAFHQASFTAIQLGRLSDELPCLSEYQEEEEILILPRTVFTVTKVEKDMSLTTIHLKYFDLHREADEFTTYKGEALFC